MTSRRPMHWCRPHAPDLSFLGYSSQLFASLASKEMCIQHMSWRTWSLSPQAFTQYSFSFKCCNQFRKRIVLPQKEIVICTCTGGLCATALRQCFRETSKMFSSPRMQDDTPRCAAIKFGTRSVAQWFTYAAPCCAPRLARSFKV